MAKQQQHTTEKTAVDFEALYSEMEATITEAGTKEYGKYLPFTWYRAEVAELTKFLCAKHGSVSTTVLRQFTTALLTKKIADMPEGMSKVMDEMGRVREEVTAKVYKERMVARLAASAKSSNNGPTITRSLGGKSNQAWLLKHHGIKFEDGQWSVNTAKVVEQQTHEEKSS